MASKALCQAQSARLPRVRIAARKSALDSKAAKQPSSSSYPEAGRRPANPPTRCSPAALMKFTSSSTPRPKAAAAPPSPPEPDPVPRAPLDRRWQEAQCLLLSRPCRAPKRQRANQSHALPRRPAGDQLLDPLAHELEVGAIDA